MVVFIAGMVVVNRADMATMLALFSLMALTNFFLVTTEEADSPVRRAGWLYLLYSHVTILGLFALFFACIALLWEMPRRLRDGRPAAIYLVLGMVPRDGPADPPAGGGERWVPNYPV